MDDHGTWQDWTERDTATRIAVPASDGDKYTRGVLGVITGSEMYPGAAVLGVEAAARTGIGMVRYLGAERAADFVLRRRPEVVTADGRVQAWLFGSGMDRRHRRPEETLRMRGALEADDPCVVDAGALDLVAELIGRSNRAPIVVTPHFRELSTLLGLAGEQVDVESIAADAPGWASRAAERLGVTVLLKGNTTYVASPDGRRIRVSLATPWLATAGSGDVLGGVLGALVATHAPAVHDDPALLAELAVTAAALHGLAGRVASAGGPLAALDVAEALPTVIAELLGIGSGSDVGAGAGSDVGSGAGSDVGSGDGAADERTSIRST